MGFENVFEEPDKPYNIRHRSFYFAKEVILFVKNCAYDKVYFSLFDQLIRSSTSIGANLVEGKAGTTRKDWTNYYAIALKSANETKYWLCLIRDTMAAERSKMDDLLNEADEIAKIVAQIIVNAKIS